MFTYEFKSYCERPIFSCFLFMSFPLDLNIITNTLKCSLTDLNLHYLNGKLSFLLININGIRGKINELRSSLQLIKQQIYFVALVEIKLSANLDVKLNLDGYNIFSVYRNEFGGGIKLYFLDHLDVQMVDDAALTGIYDSHESLCVNFSESDTQEFTIGIFYRLPDKSGRLFCDKLEYILDRYEHQKSVIMGDFNLCLMDLDNNAVTRDFAALMRSHGFINCITEPTFIKHNDKKPSSLIDHIWHNLKVDFSSYVIEPPMSDHMSCLLCLDFSPKSPLFKHSFRDYSMQCRSKFAESIINETNNFKFPNGNINDCISRFDAWFRELTDKYFPVRIKFISKKRLNNPWLTTRLIKCIRNKYWLYGRLKLGIISIDMYKTYTHLLRVTLRTDEQNYYKTHFNTIKGNSRKTWACINSLLGSKIRDISQDFLVDGTLTNDMKIISNSFADYFGSIPLKIKSEIVKPNVDLMANVPLNNRSMFLSPTKVNEVLCIVSKLKRSNEHYDLSVVVLKLGIQHFVHYIVRLFNQSVEECTYPKLLKIARVSPIFKKGNRKLIENYRPVQYFQS